MINSSEVDRMRELVSILHNLIDKLYKAYENETEIIVSLENNLLTYNHTIKLSDLNIEKEENDYNIYIVDSWLEVNIKITPKVNVEYNNEDTFLISDNNLKILITFL